MKSFWLSVLVLFLAPLVSAQNSSNSGSLSPAERVGEKLFIQRCSLCHLGYPMNYTTYGPPLYKELIVETGEKAVREKIMDGDPLMPGWKYSLTSADVDKIMAYLKTVKKQDIPVAGNSETGPGEEK